MDNSVKNVQISSVEQHSMINILPQNRYMKAIDPHQDNCQLKENDIKIHAEIFLPIARSYKHWIRDGSFSD
jgi:hypothetical protein